MTATAQVEHETLSSAEILGRLARVGPAGIAVLEDVTPTWVEGFFAFKVLGKPRFNEWGRGTTREAAGLGALMERVERLSAFAAAKRIETVSLVPGQLEIPVITLADLGLCNFQRFESLDRTESQHANQFVEVKRLRDDAAVLAPASRVFLGYRGAVNDASCSTGLAAHFSREEATARGFLEVLERHAHHIIRFGDLKPAGAFDLAKDPSIASALRRLVDQLHAAGFRITVRAAPWTDELHTIVVYLDHPGDRDSDTRLGGRFHVAVHWDVQVATERALTECLLSRSVANWSPHPVKATHTASGAEALDSARLSELRNKPPVTTLEAVRRLADALRLEAYWCDLTLPETGIPVVRVLTPGLQPNFELLGRGPLDARARLTPHLTRFTEWTEQVRAGNFDKDRKPGGRQVRTNTGTQKAAVTAAPEQRESVVRDLIRGAGPREAGTAISLPAPQSGFAVEAPILARRTVREVSGAIALGELSTLLRLAVGSGTQKQVEPWGLIERRNYPSAGGLHPLIFLVEARDCTALDAGAYIYDHCSNQLTPLALPKGVTLCRQTPQERALDPAVVLRMVRYGVRQRRKYGRASERLCAIEAGHAGQNLLLLAAELGINAVPLGNTSPQLPVLFSNAPQSHAALIYSIALGKPAPRGPRAFPALH